MWQPHTKVNTQRGKRVLSLGGLFCGASGARPPSLGCFLWGFPFSALKVPRGDHTLQDLQQSVVHHERAPSQELERSEVSHGALYKASSTVRSLLSVHSLLRVSSSRTRSSSRSSPLGWSVFCSHGGDNPRPCLRLWRRLSCWAFLITAPVVLEFLRLAPRITTV